MNEVTDDWLSFHYLGETRAKSGYGSKRQELIKELRMTEIELDIAFISRAASYMSPRAVEVQTVEVKKFQAKIQNIKSELDKICIKKKDK